MWTKVAKSSLCSALLLTACVEPLNPCDPAADPSVQGEATSVSGVVVDTAGTPLAGVPVAVTGRTETAISGTDGTFTLLKLPPASSYELVALATAPQTGGRVQTPALECRGKIEGMELPVVIPPSSPDVELVKASGDRRLLVAFGGIEDVTVDPLQDSPESMYDKGAEDGGEQPYRAIDDVVTTCVAHIDSAAVTFRLQVRSPFGAWQDAVIAPFPWAAELPVDDPTTDLDERAPAGSLTTAEGYVGRIDDWCSAAICSQFAYLDNDLRDPLARCAEVVGTVEGDHLEPLERFASYHVRVLSELKTPAALRDVSKLPTRVEGAAATATGQISLVPGAVLPLIDPQGAARDPGSANVVGITVTAGGRFTVIADDEAMVVGDGADTHGAGAEVSGVAHDSMGEDTAGSANMTDQLYAAAPPDAEAISVLPAGNWVRVLRRSASSSSTIQKLYVGDDASAARDGPAPIEAAANLDQPLLQFDPDEPALGGMRSLGYGLRPGGALAVEGQNPHDLYLMIYPTAFVIDEQSVGIGDHRLSFLASAASRGALELGTWADGLGNATVDDAGLGGACAQVPDAANRFGNTVTLDGIGDGPQREHTSICFDVAAALGADVNLGDVEVLDAPGGFAGDAFQLITDSESDRVLVARTRDLLCLDCGAVDAAAPTPLAQVLTDNAVDVGREPTGMTRSLLLEQCPDEGAPPRPVVLVANRKSSDLSVLAVDADRVREVQVVPMPTNVVGFLDDADGPTCDDPFAWVIGDDGRVFPVDMRGVPAVPLCDGRPCEVGTRGRATTGAVGRPVVAGISHRARALIGGPGLIGEMGFFKPKALNGAAFEAPVVVDEASAESGER